MRTWMNTVLAGSLLAGSPGTASAQAPAWRLVSEGEPALE